MLAMPDKFGGVQSLRLYIFMVVFLALGIVAFSVGVLKFRSGWGSLRISREQKSGSFKSGLRLDATGLLARPAMKGKPLSCIYVPHRDIAGVDWEAKGKTVSGDQYRTIDHYARLDLKNQQQVFLYLNSFEGKGVDLAAEIKRWAAKSERK